GEILGKDLRRDRAEIKRRIGYVAQHFGLYLDLTVEENVRFYGDLYEPRATRKTLEYRDFLLEKYGLARYRKTIAGNLSGGFKQRLALITAITHKPELIFLDEPTAGVDPVTRKEIWDLFYDLAHEGATLFVTTHYMEEAERCDRLAFIFDGRVVVEGAPQEIKKGLAGREVFTVRGRYDRRVVERARALEGVETVNQFGDTLRVIARSGLHAEASLARELGFEAGDIGRATPSIEDVFVNLTERRR
ncbi:MAG: ABC transporter ATP-binding protein, partial [Sandaracinaceae bacterium]|nr:ABC transporter ATP-binding protein [Sandaracinaceae bacterium]